MIFLIEDEPLLRRSIVEFLRTKGFEVQDFDNAEDALVAARKSTPDLAISDIQLPGMDGLSFLEQLGQIDPGIVRIVMTAHTTASTALRAMRQGCYEYLEKPLDLKKLSRLIERALSERQQGRELAWLRGNTTPDDTSQRILGQSKQIETIRQRIEALGALGSNAPPVLIMGETGVGKGLIARAVHVACLGADAPWIEVNCAALPETLIESELFGYERSAFTDAKQAKPGLFEAAAKGSVFLDEIGEVSPSVQAKLLKVVESRTVRRLGAVRDRPISAMVVAASNVALQKAVQTGGFRADLFHRLAAFIIEVPPLRERKGDALLLAHTFLQDSVARYHKPLERFSADAATRIDQAQWPGNVRELRFAIERAVILAPTGAIELTAENLFTGTSSAMIPEAVPAAPCIASAGPEGGIRVDGDRIEVILPAQGIAFEDLEKAILRAALERTGGNVMQASEYLQMSRDTLRYRIRKFQLA